MKNIDGDRKNVLYSFELKTSLLPNDFRVEVVDGSRLFHFVARKGSNRHVYANIPVSNVPQIRFNTWYEVTTLASGNAVFHTAEQQRMDVGLEAVGPLRYKKEVRGVPTSAVITFPHFKGHGGFPAPYTLLDGAQYDFDDTLYLSFQDSFLTAGSYFLCGNHGEDPMDDVVRTIKTELARYGIDESATTFLGSSKGANSAALASSHFAGNELIVCAYATDLEHFLKSTDYAYLADYLGFMGKDIPDYDALLFGQAAEKDVHWLYSTIDEVSNRGNETRTAQHLSKHACPQAHPDVIGSNKGLLLQLLANRHG